MALRKHVFKTLMLQDQPVLKKSCCNSKVKSDDENEPLDAPGHRRFFFDLNLVQR